MSGECRGRMGLDQAREFVGRFVVFANPHQAVAVVLWMSHTHIAADLWVTPYLHITSPEPEAGKSRLLDVLELLVANPWRAIQPSEAAVFRKLDASHPTLLLDEADPIFGREGRRDPDAEPLRAVLNGGHSRGASVVRCSGVGSNQSIRDFDVFGPKAIAGIGELPDSLRSRSIRIAMRRRLPSEPVEPFFRDEVEDAAALIREGLAVAARNALPLNVRGARRELLELGLGDRAADGWGALIAIADHAGGDWPSRARDAAVALSAAKPDKLSQGVQLLVDVAAVFGELETDRIATTALIERLAAIEGAPWGDWQGKRIGPHAIAKLLQPFGIGPGTIRIGQGTAKGYMRAAFEDTWARYVPSGPSHRHITTNTTGFTHAEPAQGPDQLRMLSHETPSATSDVPVLRPQPPEDSDPVGVVDGGGAEMAPGVALALFVELLDGTVVSSGEAPHRAGDPDQ